MSVPGVAQGVARVLSFLAVCHILFIHNFWPMFSMSTEFYKEEELCAFQGTCFETQPWKELCNHAVFPSPSMDA